MSQQRLIDLPGGWSLAGEMISFPFSFFHALNCQSWKNYFSSCFIHSNFPGCLNCESHFSFWWLCSFYAVDRTSRVRSNQGFSLKKKGGLLWTKSLSFLLASISNEKWIRKQGNFSAIAGERFLDVSWPNLEIIPASFSIRFFDEKRMVA